MYYSHLNSLYSISTEYYMQSDIMEDINYETQYIYTQNKTQDKDDMEDVLDSIIIYNTIDDMEDDTTSIYLY
jgi:hypothetical protein